VSGVSKADFWPTTLPASLLDAAEPSSSSKFVFITSPHKASILNWGGMIAGAYGQRKQEERGAK